MTIRAQVTLSAVSGMAADAAVNTFHFQGDHTISGANATSIKDALVSFYNDVHSPGILALSKYLSSTRSRSADACFVRLYDTEMVGVPAFAEYTWTLGANGTGPPANWPEEVALCLSYKLTGASGAQARRQRGRVYIGPLNDTAASGPGGSTAGTRPLSAFQDVLLGAGKALALASHTISPGPNYWSVHSTYGSTPGSSPPDVQTNYTINQVSVDDAFDTQRRRGVKPTSKITAAV